jgi:hypothetical protein
MVKVMHKFLAKKRAWLHFGPFFNKQIWSPCWQRWRVEQFFADFSRSAAATKK